MRRMPLYPFVQTEGLLTLGRTAEAEAVFRKFLTVNQLRLEEGTGEFSTWMTAMLLEQAVALGAREEVETLSRLLRRANVVTGGLFWPAIIDRARGDAEAFLGDFDGARACYNAAIESGRELQFRPEVALIRLRLANLLLDHYPDDRAEALGHLDFAVGEFRAMKMAPALEQAMALRMAQQGIAEADPQTSIDAVAMSVETERPDLTQHAAPDGTVTLLFSDIDGGKALRERLGDVAWAALLRQHNTILRAPPTTATRSRARATASCSPSAAPPMGCAARWRCRRRSPPTTPGRSRGSACASAYIPARSPQRTTSSSARTWPWRPASLSRRRRSRSWSPAACRR